MRVLLWTEQYWPYIGGLEVLATRFATAMRQRGHDVVVVTSHGSVELPDTEERQGVPVHRMPFYQALSEGNLDLLLESRARVSRLKKDFEADLVHVAMIAPSVFFHLQTAAAWRCPLLVTQQLSAADSQTGGADTLLGQVLAAADWITGCAASVVDELIQMAPALANRSTVIPNGVRAPDLAPAPHPLDPPVLLGLGRLVPEKGFDRALRALPAILAAHPDARLVFVGDGPERPALESLAAELGVESAVELPGFAAPEDVPARINRSTLLLMPSRSEAMPLVAIEAALLERPVVATAVGGVPEFVDDGRTGLIVDGDDAAALAAAVNGLLAEPARLAAMGAAARDRAAESFTWESYLDAYEALYDTLVSGDRVDAPLPA